MGETHWERGQEGGRRGEEGGEKAKPERAEAHRARREEEEGKRKKGRKERRGGGKRSTGKGQRRRKAEASGSGRERALQNPDGGEGKHARPPNIKYLTGDDKSNGNYSGKNIIRNVIEVKQNLHNTAN